jgi:hypothetical protein
MTDEGGLLTAVVSGSQLGRAVWAGVRRDPAGYCSIAATATSADPKVRLMPSVYTIVADTILSIAT